MEVVTSVASTKYSAGLTSQSFWFVEFKKIIKLMHTGKTEEEIKSLCLKENLLCASNEYRARRIYRYLWNRVKQLDQTMIKIFVDSDLFTQKIINLICIVKTDQLFFEFLYEVYREKAILGFQKIEDADISTFFSRKEFQDESIAFWTDGTKKKLCNIYKNYLVGANLLTVENNEKKITLPILDHTLERYLREQGESTLIKALTGVR